MFSKTLPSPKASTCTLPVPGTPLATPPDCSACAVTACVPSGTTRTAATPVLHPAVMGPLVEFATYEGGHGWKGDVFGNIRTGVEWLEKQHATK